MKFKPDNLSCEVCNAPATVQLHHSATNTEHLFCSSHKPDLSPGKKHSEWTILRYRLLPGSSLSQDLAAEESSEKHQSFCEYMCETMMLGNDGANRYYLSKITNSDQFTLWNDEFLDNVQEYIIDQTDGAAAEFYFNSETINSMSSFLKCALLDSRPDLEIKITKQDRAVELFLHNPSWSDEQIAENVPITLKQLQRFADFKILRNRALKSAKFY